MIRGFCKLVILGMTFFTACTSKKSLTDEKYANYSVSINTAAIKIPEGLWDRLEDIAAGKALEAGHNSQATTHSVGNDSGDAAHGSGVQAGHGTEQAQHAPSQDGHSGTADANLAAQKKPIEFKPIAALLVEENRGVLHAKNHKIEFGPGGGELDLRDFVSTEQKGAFRLGFVFEPNRQPNTPSAVFYVSNARKRKVAGDPFASVWGAGCSHYFDISSRFEQIMRDRGFLVHTNDNRHLSALAGTYVFAVANDLSLGVAQVTIKDSRFRDLQCRN